MRIFFRHTCAGHSTGFLSGPTCNETPTRAHRRCLVLALGSRFAFLRREYYASDFNALLCVSKPLARMVLEHCIDYFLGLPSRCFVSALDVGNMWHRARPYVNENRLRELVAYQHHAYACYRASLTLSSTQLDTNCFTYEPEDMAYVFIETRSLLLDRALKDEGLVRSIIAAAHEPEVCPGRIYSTPVASYWDVAYDASPDGKHRDVTTRRLRWRRSTPDVFAQTTPKNTPSIANLFAYVVDDLRLPRAALLAAIRATSPNTCNCDDPDSALCRGDARCAKTSRPIRHSTVDSDLADELEFLSRASSHTRARKTRLVFDFLGLRGRYKTLCDCVLYDHSRCDPRLVAACLHPDCSTYQYESPSETDTDVSDYEASFN